ncbi:MAG: CoA-acylating methylmalonate-semialdehyde dehydrogenase [Candidatus Bipolaricaulota bacterium]|nr:CoA-acylating methylmalonate-semialdehyde dehydrogenase [Candidatus Bipolaricaulota bacterium]
MAETLKNYIGGKWTASDAKRALDVRNPATGEAIARVPLSTAGEVRSAVAAAKAAFPAWRETPPLVRARYMFRLKALLEEHFEDLARTVTAEHGKIIDEARGEVRRAIENVEVAAGVPSLMMGYNAEDIAVGIDEDCVFQPIGVFACVAPFNFPAMVPFWFLPYAVACGDTYVVKPSEVCPMSQSRLFELLDAADLPPGVVNLVNGDKEAVDALLADPDVAGVSFVGSTPVGRYIYATAAAHGKRAQCQAGAKNALVVMPDAVIDRTVAAILTSAYGTAGQRCLAGSLVVAVGDVYEPLKAELVRAASRIKVGDGLDESTQMGPVVSKKSLDRILSYIEKGLAEGARLLLDGRKVKVEGYPNGYFVGPTLFDCVRPEMTIAREEIFGPVLGIVRVDTFDEAVATIEALPYGNAASLFTSSGKWAREFRYCVPCGNVGINVGIAAPIASFPFAGMKDSFFGDLHGQGRDAIQFFTDRKVVITRWF